MSTSGGREGAEILILLVQAPIELFEMPQLKIELPRFGLATWALSCFGANLMLPCARLEAARTRRETALKTIQSNGQTPPKQRCNFHLLVLVSLRFIFHSFCSNTHSGTTLRIFPVLSIRSGYSRRKLYLYSDYSYMFRVP